MRKLFLSFFIFCLFVVCCCDLESFLESGSNCSWGGNKKSYFIYLWFDVFFKGFCLNGFVKLLFTAVLRAAAALELLVVAVCSRLRGLIWRLAVCFCGSQSKHQHQNKDRVCLLTGCTSSKLDPLVTLTSPRWSRIVVFTSGFNTHGCLSRSSTFFFLLFPKTFAWNVYVRTGGVIILRRATGGEERFSVRQMGRGICEYIIFHSVSKRTHSHGNWSV